ncbi:MAG: bifunctional [glutamine synthetase] adenylyltransferase/[glutamine synthetase]-adenylyl-L-tyrosine phosphorylase [Robiginitomaculum sp.]
MENKYDLFETRFGKAKTSLIINAHTLNEFIETVRHNAPYLDSLCVRWPDIIDDISKVPPENILEIIMDELKPYPLKILRSKLRCAKQKLHLLIALCDLAGLWDWKKVTRYLSDFSDRAMELLIEATAQEMQFDAGDYGSVSGLFVLALGKYGGRELNYSSDIDLIVFYDPDLIKLPNPERAERTLVKFVRMLMRGFDEVTQHGYIFRTDLRLRPDPRANSVAVSTLTAERYYESLGQNWERSAMIKARYCGGDKRAADMFIKNVLTPFVWRSSLDFSAVADIHSIKRQSQFRTKDTDFLAPGHDVKLGIGGIREIELFTSIQQLILGGRNKTLRTPRTVDALGALANGQYIDHVSVKKYNQAYGYLRDLEHRIQMFADEQTHIWPKDIEKREKLAKLCGAKNTHELEQNIQDVLKSVHEIYEALFSEEEDLSTAKGPLMFTGVSPEALSLQTLEAYGFKRGEEVWSLIAEWLGGRIRATRSERARELLTRLAPRIIEMCGNTGVPDAAFFNFAKFITRLTAGVTLFSLFVNKPQALQTLIKMITLAPPLTVTLAHSPSLIDPMVEPDFLSVGHDCDTPKYAQLFTAEMDYEDALNTMRRNVHEDQLSLVATLLNMQDIEGAGQVFSGIAQGAIDALLPICAREIEKRFGKIQGNYAVIGLGKLGGCEMRYTSDIDIMLLYEPYAGENVEPYNTLTRRLITALSSVTHEGKLYDVDMALRPSGRSGPLAVSLNAFNTYYNGEAWTWEFMALTRARIIATSSPQFSQKIDTLIDQQLLSKSYNGKLEIDILEMHSRLNTQKPATHEWQIKRVPGGLQDIEFIAQYLMLKYKPNRIPSASVAMLSLAQEEGWLDRKYCRTLQSALEFYTVASQMFAITTKDMFAPKNASDTAKRTLAQSLKINVENPAYFSDLEVLYFGYRKQVLEVFNNILSSACVHRH